MWTHFEGLGTKLLLTTSYDFLTPHFKKRKKFNVKYVFSNTDSDQKLGWASRSFSCCTLFQVRFSSRFAALDKMSADSASPVRGSASGMCRLRTPAHCLWSSTAFPPTPDLTCQPMSSSDSLRMTMSSASRTAEEMYALLLAYLFIYLLACFWHLALLLCLQCFDAVGWASGRESIPGL